MSPDRTGGPPIEVRALRGLDEYAACVALQKATWGEDCAEIVPVSVLVTIPRLGGLVGGAFQEGELVGIVVGFTGLDEGDRPIHWSDMLAVRPGLRDAGVGERLKRFQRERVMARGIGHVYWTFDPLESRNAYLNFVRLGAASAEYLVDHYGQTDSPLHAGIGTDRLVADWAVATPRVEHALAGRPERVLAGPGPDALRTIPADVEADRAGTWPAPLTGDVAGDPSVVRVAIPADIQSLKTADPALARRWREATRAAFVRRFHAGYAAVDLVRDGAVSHHLLRKG